MPGPRALIALFLAALVLLGADALLDPRVPLLVDGDGARWIRAPEEFSPVLRRPSRERRFFRPPTRVQGSAAREAGGSLRAFRSAVVSLDNRVLVRTDDGDADWKRARSFDCSVPPDGSGHDLLIVAENDNAHPAISFCCPALGLRSDASWEVSEDGVRWFPAVLADGPVQLPIWNDEDTVPAAFAATLRWQAGIFAVVVACGLLLRFRPHLRRLATPSSLRWTLLAAWTVLGINDLVRLPPGHGFDVQDHVAYVRQIVELRRLPLASDGWEMFQPPLFYLVSAAAAPLVSIAGASLEQGLRLLPLACGALQIEITYRIARAAFPDQPASQRVALLIGSFLPVNLYMAQAVGNEPLFAVITSAILLQCMNVLRAPSTRSKSFLRLGLLLGLALLAKASAWLLFPILATVIVASFRPLAGHARSCCKALLACFAPALAVSGWFYLRNWIHFGKPLVTGWDDEIGIRWWQDPGYRVPEEMFRFGFALKTPILASVRGFWDGLYSTLWADGGLSGVIGYPPWNYAFLFPVLWLGLPVTAAIAAGAVLPVPAETRAARSLAVLALATFLLALLHLYLRIPIYVAAKASYTLGITPCYGILAAAGLRPILASKAGRIVVTGWLAVLAVFVYVAYFATPTS